MDQLVAQAALLFRAGLDEDAIAAYRALFDIFTLSER
jgi:hypothetical protein